VLDSRTPLIRFEEQGESKLRGLIKNLLAFYDTL
jgi:hypothetical protein